MKKIYLSGPMTGYPALNAAAFNKEAYRLRNLGYAVVNPAELNLGEEDYNTCMRTDIAALMQCDTLALLPEWEKSNGAHLEMHIAHRVGIAVVNAQSISTKRIFTPQEKSLDAGGVKKKAQLYEIRGYVKYGIVIAAMSKADALNQVSDWEHAWDEHADLIDANDIEVVDVRKIEGDWSDCAHLCTLAAAL